MGIFSWILMGLIAGALAKWIMPGKDPGGFFVTILIGIAGGFLGGFIGSTLGFGTVSGFDLRSLGLAIGGALILLFGYRQLKQNRE
ncbi:MAG: GlsB/YeaQ/YmgE family stress response membrane protein [Chromatiales bacterium]|nr:GlsB/YeaQ/YmgE family stress response membrane protein [Chromatiales bacterium]